MSRKHKEQTWRYEIRVDGRVWVVGDKPEPVQAAAENARRGWAKGRKIEIVDTKQGTA